MVFRTYTVTTWEEIKNSLAFDSQENSCNYPFDNDKLNLKRTQEFLAKPKKEWQLLKVQA